jgi:hypothetical protein
MAANREQIIALRAVYIDTAPVKKTGTSNVGTFETQQVPMSYATNIFQTLCIRCAVIASARGGDTAEANQVAQEGVRLR